MFSKERKRFLSRVCSKRAFAKPSPEHQQISREKWRWPSLFVWSPSCGKYLLSCLQRRLCRTFKGSANMRHLPKNRSLFLQCCLSSSRRKKQNVIFHRRCLEGSPLPNLGWFCISVSSTGKYPFITSPNSSGATHPQPQFSLSSKPRNGLRGYHHRIKAQSSLWCSTLLFVEEGRVMCKGLHFRIQDLFVILCSPSSLIPRFRVKKRFVVVFIALKDEESPEWKIKPSFHSKREDKHICIEKKRTGFLARQLSNGKSFPRHFLTLS